MVPGDVHLKPPTPLAFPNTWGCREDLDVPERVHETSGVAIENPSAIMAQLMA